MTIGEKISTRRKELGLTLEDVGNFVGVGKSTVKKWESGYIANMRRDKIAALSKILQMNPAEFINSDIENCNITCNTEKMSKESDVYDKIKECFGEQVVELIHMFVEFNAEGREKLLDTATDMSQLDRYKKYTKKESSEKKSM